MGLPQSFRQLLALHSTPPPVGPGDWLYFHKEPPQSLGQFRTRCPHPRKGQQLYVVPLGPFVGSHQRILSLVAEWTELYLGYSSNFNAPNPRFLSCYPLKWVLTPPKDHNPSIIPPPPPPSLTRTLGAQIAAKRRGLKGYASLLGIRLMVGYFSSEGRALSKGGGHDIGGVPIYRNLEKGKLMVN